MSTHGPDQERFTPQQRRARLRAFADRMLERLDDLPPPEDAPEMERTVRIGLLIERLYARVDAAERKAPLPERTDEEIAADRREHERHYREFVLRWGLTPVPPPVPDEPAPISHTFDPLAPYGMRTAPSYDEDDGFEGYDFEDDIDDELEVVTEASPSKIADTEARAAFKAAFCALSEGANHAGSPSSPDSS